MARSDDSLPRLDAGADRPGDPGESPPVRPHRFKLSRHAKSPTPNSREEETPAILAELLLLREENAWLKAAQHQAPGIGEAIQRVRALPGDQQQHDDREDDAAQILVEAHVLRESLLQLCDEIQRVTAIVQTRLAGLSFTEPDHPTRFEDSVCDDLIRDSVIHVHDGEEVS